MGGACKEEVEGGDAGEEGENETTTKCINWVPSSSLHHHHPHAQVINKANETTDIPFGACVWATGIAMNPLIKQLQEKLPGQKHFRWAWWWESLGRGGERGKRWHTT